MSKGIKKRKMHIIKHHTHPKIPVQLIKTSIYYLNPEKNIPVILEL